MADTTSIQALEPLQFVVKDVRKVDIGLDGTIDSFYREVAKRALSRGWKQILLLDLPALGSVYDTGLSRGFLDFQKVPASFGKLGPHNFEDSWIFRSLLQHTFDGLGNLDSTAPVEVVWATRQLLYLYKKASIACPDEGITSAVDDYIDIEVGLRRPHGTWDSDIWLPVDVSFLSSSGDLTSAGLRGDYWRLLDLVFGRLVPAVQLLPEGVVPRHGPGAVSDVRSGGDKYAFPNWPAKLGRLFSSPEFAHANEYLAYTDDIGIGASEKEPPCKLLAVPKTFKGPRLIASEPTSHQFIQQGLMAWIRQHMPDALRTCVNFLDQRPSQEAALEASRTGEQATVDLSSASDRLSCWVVERAFRSNQSLLAALHAARTRVVVDATNTHEGLSMRLKKFAAQGSAATFPVQTIVYAGCAIAAILYDQTTTIGGKFGHGQNLLTSGDVMQAAQKVRVFGDDIVLPSPNVPTLTAALHALQLKVNVSKTHYLGRFRESCGMDAYRGHDVTPCYVGDLQLKPDAESLAAWVDVSNVFHASGLWHTADWMLTRVPIKERKSILVVSLREELDYHSSPVDEPGIRATTFCRGTRFHGSVRYNEQLQTQEYRVLCASVKDDKVARGSFQDLLQYFTEKPAPETKWSAGVSSGKLPLVKSQRWVPIYHR